MIRSIGFPDLKLVARNCGVAGAPAPQFARRAAADLEALAPAEVELPSDARSVAEMLARSQRRRLVLAFPLHYTIDALPSYKEAMVGP